MVYLLVTSQYCLPLMGFMPWVFLGFRFDQTRFILRNEESVARITRFVLLMPALVRAFPHASLHSIRLHTRRRSSGGSFVWAAQADDKISRAKALLAGFQSAQRQFTLTGCIVAQNEEVSTHN